MSVCYDYIFKFLPYVIFQFSSFPVLLWLRKMELPKLSRWPVFSLLSQDFLQQVRLACVFGSAGNEAVVVCDDSEVYALGSNTSGCLGVGDLRSSLQPRKIETLCGKGILHPCQPCLIIGKFNCLLLLQFSPQLEAAATHPSVKILENIHSGTYITMLSTSLLRTHLLRTPL